MRVAKHRLAGLRIKNADGEKVRRILELAFRTLYTTVRRGRDAGYPAPPAQIPASGITAQGSYLR